MNTTEQHQPQRWRYIGILFGSVALAVAFGIQLILMIPTTYTATSAIALRPMTAEVAADSVELLAHEYGVMVGSTETAAMVQARSGSGSNAHVSVSTVQDPGTATVRINVSSTSRAAALEVANALAGFAVDQGKDDVTTQVVPVVEAGDAGVAAAPPRKFYLAALLCVAALVLGAGLYRMRERAPSGAL